jgi:hypothetical protein
VADCTQASFGFPACRKRAVEVDFSGGAVSSSGGVLLLRAADRRLGLRAAAARVVHWLSKRLYGIFSVKLFGGRAIQSCLPGLPG